MKTLTTLLIASLALGTVAAPMAGLAAPSQAAPARQGIQEKYTLKIAPNSLSPTEFTLTINGQTVGSYDEQSEVDLTDRFKKGKNVIVVKWRSLAPFKNQFAKTTLTIGAQRNGKWSTILKVTSSQATPKGTRTLAITAK